MILGAHSASKRPSCIASVRVEALRASGLRAAAAAHRVSLLHGRGPIPGYVPKCHCGCLQGNHIPCSSNASSSISSLAVPSSSTSSCILSTSLPASLRSSSDSISLPHLDPHFDAKNPSPCRMLDYPSSCGERVYKRRKFGESTLKKHACAAYSSRRFFNETSTEASLFLSSSSMPTIYSDHSQHLLRDKSSIYLPSSTTLMGLSRKSDAVSDAQVVQQVCGQEPQSRKLMKPLLDVNDRRPLSVLGRKSFGNDVCVYKTPKQTPEEVDNCIGQQGSACCYAKLDDKRVHARPPYVDARSSSFVLEAKAFSKDNRVCEMKGITKTQEELMECIQHQAFTSNYSKVKDVDSSLEVNDQSSFSLLSKSAFGKDDGVHKSSDQTKLSEELRENVPQQTSTHRHVKVKKNSVQVIGPLLDMKGGKSSLGLGKHALCMDYKAIRQTKPRAQCIEPQGSANTHTQEKENNVHTKFPLSSRVSDFRSSTVLGKRTSSKTYKTSEKTPPSEERGKNIRQQTSTISYSMMKGSDVLTGVPRWEEHEVNASNEHLPQKVLCPQIAQEASELVMPNTEMKSSNVHLVEGENIGPDTQIALEAMDLIMGGAEVRANDIHLDKNEDIGFRKQTTFKEITLMPHDSNANLDKDNTEVDILIHANMNHRGGMEQDANAHGEDIDIGANTQIALEAMNLMKSYSTMNETTNMACKSLAGNEHVTKIGIGANTQVALEAMDLMMGHTMMNETIVTEHSCAANSNEKDVDTGVNTQMSLEAMDTMIGHTMMNETGSVKRSSHTANVYMEDMEIAANTQIALEAMHLMIGHSTVNATVSEKGNSHPGKTKGEDVDTVADTHMILEAMNHPTTNETAPIQGMTYTNNAYSADAYGEDMDIGPMTQVALQAMDLMIGHSTKNETVSAPYTSDGANLFQEVDISSDTQIARGDSDAEILRGEEMDIGADTQVALEAMNLMIIHSTKSKEISASCAVDAANLSQEVDIGADTQITLEAMDSMKGCTLTNETASVAGSLYEPASVRGDSDEDVGIGADKQIAVAATELKRGHAMMNETVAGKFQEHSIAENLSGEEVDIGLNTQVAIEAMNLMAGENLIIGHATLNERASMRSNAQSEAVDIGADTQTALEGINLIMNLSDDRSTQSVVEATNNMRTGTQINPKFMGIENRQKDKVVGPRQPFFNRGQKKSGGEVSRGKQTPLSKAKRNVLSKDITINLKNFSGLAAIEDVYTPQNSAIVSAVKEKTVEAVTVKTSKDVMNRKNSPCSFLISAVPRKKRTPRSTSINSFSRNILIFQQDGENNVCKPGFGKRVHPQKCNVKTQNLANLAESTREGLPEKTRKVNTVEPITNNARRKTRKQVPRCIRVLFSHSLPNDVMRHQKKILTRLGGQTTNQAADSTHFVSDAFVRTKNMLESLASGKNIVTTRWLEGCNQAQHFIEEKNYILRDLKKEKELGFCMLSSLAASRQKPLLEDMTFVVSPNTIPDFEGMTAIIKSAGGQVTKSVRTGTKESKSTPIVIGSKEDFEFCVSFLERGITVYSTEFILHGIIVQNLDFSRNRLFEDYCK